MWKTQPTLENFERSVRVLKKLGNFRKNENNRTWGFRQRKLRESFPSPGAVKTSGLRNLSRSYSSGELDIILGGWGVEAILTWLCARVDLHTSLFGPKNRKEKLLTGPQNKLFGPEVWRRNFELDGEPRVGKCEVFEWTDWRGFEFRGLVIIH